jgi:hypothetical protein
MDQSASQNNPATEIETLERNIRNANEDFSVRGKFAAAALLIGSLGVGISLHNDSESAANAAPDHVATAQEAENNLVKNAGSFALGIGFLSVLGAISSKNEADQMKNRLTALTAQQSRHFT